MIQKIQKERDAITRINIAAGADGTDTGIKLITLIEHIIILICQA